MGIVYGGASVGMMGALADAALAAGGEVIGVIPGGLFAAEIPHPGLTRMEVVSTMHERKALMADLADGFAALPGGLGTLDELFEILTWQQIGLHAKPVALVNVGGFWDPLAGLLAELAATGFISDATHRALTLVGDAAEFLSCCPDLSHWPGRRCIGPKGAIRPFIVLRAAPGPRYRALGRRRRAVADEEGGP